MCDAPCAIAETACSRSPPTSHPRHFFAGQRRVANFFSVLPSKVHPRHFFRVSVGPQLLCQLLFPCFFLATLVFFSQSLFARKKQRSPPFFCLLRHVVLPPICFLQDFGFRSNYEIDLNPKSLPPKPGCQKKIEVRRRRRRSASANHHGVRRPQ